MAQDRKRLAVKMLSEGHIQGFVDFMYLAHRRDLDRIRPSDEELLVSIECLPNFLQPYFHIFLLSHTLSSRVSVRIHSQQARRIDPERYQGVVDFPLEHVPALYAHLTAADAAAHRSDVPGSFEAYQGLADYFEESGALDEALTYFQRCLSIARATGWRQAELMAEARIGNVLQRMGLGTDALAHHERQLELSRETGAQGAMRSAMDHLLEAYQTQVCRKPAVVIEEEEGAVYMSQMALDDLLYSPSPFTSTC